MGLDGRCLCACVCELCLWGQLAQESRRLPQYQNFSELSTRNELARCSFAWLNIALVAPEGNCFALAAVVFVEPES